MNNYYLPYHIFYVRVKRKFLLIPAIVYCMEEGQIPTPEKQVNTSEFAHKIESLLLDEPTRFQTISENYRYRSGSASFFYGQRSCEEIIHNLDDPLGFFSASGTFFSSENITTEFYCRVE